MLPVVSLWVYPQVEKLSSVMQKRMKKNFATYENQDYFDTDGVTEDDADDVTEDDTDVRVMVKMMMMMLLKMMKVMMKKITLMMIMMVMHPQTLIIYGTPSCLNFCRIGVISWKTGWRN